MEITFRPLSRNRYRCNQTGIVVFKAMIPSYTNALLAAGKKAANALVVRVPKPEANEQS